MKQIPFQLQAAAAVVLVVLLAWVVTLVRRQRLSLRDSLLWLLSTGGALVVTVFPSALWWLAHLLHVEVPSNALFALSILYLILNVLGVTVAVSGNAARLRRVAQECALLRAEVDALKRSRGGDE